VSVARWVEGQQVRVRELCSRVSGTVDARSVVTLVGRT